MLYQKEIDSYANSLINAMKRRFSLKEISEKTGVSLSMIYKLNSCNQSCGYWTFLKIEKAYKRHKQRGFYNKTKITEEREDDLTTNITINQKSEKPPESVNKAFAILRTDRNKLIRYFLDENKRLLVSSYYAKFTIRFSPEYDNVFVMKHCNPMPCFKEYDFFLDVEIKKE